MKTYIIKKGKHRAWPIRFGIYWRKQTISFDVMFDGSCKYFLQGEDQQDINKLFGIGYFKNHHIDSARFGWRFNENLNKIELFAYCYVNGVRIWEFITSVAIYQKITLTLNINDGEYLFNAKKDQLVLQSSIKFTHNKKIGYPMDVFFGGNHVAPQRIKIVMKKRK